MKAEAAGNYSMVGFSYGDEKKSEEPTEDKFVPTSSIPDSIPLV